MVGPASVGQLAQHQPSHHRLPRLVLLPSGNVFMPAPDAMTYQFNPVANTWYFVAATKFGFRFYAPHVLLNGFAEVLVAGGTSSEASGASLAPTRPKY